MQCEMCGSEIDSEALRAEVEGSVINVCKKCSRYGKIVGRISMASPLGRKEVEKRKDGKTAAAPTPVDQVGETVLVLVADYANKIKSGRERLGLKQEELAKKLNEKDSLLSKIETGTVEPSVKLARKLEHFFDVKLIEEHKEEGKSHTKDRPNQVTLGDFARLRKR
jgi:putative transcription factor